MAHQAAHLAAEGYRELVLTGIEIASYGRDLPGELTLADAVETVAAAAPQMRLRLGSLEPTVITEDFCRRAAATGRVCRHFHLSLQSGCDRTLARMNRKYSTAEFLVCVERLRRYFPGCALTADMITGFPVRQRRIRRLRWNSWSRSASRPCTCFRIPAAPAQKRTPCRSSSATR